MKEYIFFLAILLSGNIAAQSKTSFIIKGEIEGLKKGDILFLETVQLPHWETLKKEMLLVNKDNHFSFEIPAKNTHLYNLFLSQRIPPITGIPIIARPNDIITIQGDVKTFATSIKKGGFYDNPLIFKKDSLEAVFNGKYIALYQKRNELENQKVQNTDSINFYDAQMSDVYKSPVFNKLKDSITHKVNDNEFAIITFMQDAQTLDYPQWKTRYDKLQPNVKSSYYGKILQKTVEEKKQLQIGSNLPKFTLITSKNKKISLSDYKGKYLLLYYWTALCAGSSQFRPLVHEMYEKYHNKGLEIISITSQTENSHRDTLNDELFDIFIKPHYQAPWDLVIQTDNKEALKKYHFTVSPTVILVSPQGKILYSDFNNPILAKVLQENIQ